jgi:amino acid transporter
MAPKIFTKTDSQGGPWPSLILTLILDGGLSHLNASASASQVFSWMSSLTSLCSLFNWGLIFTSHIRFRLAWTSQGHSLQEIAWRSWAAPYSSYYGLACCIALIGVEFYLAVWPLGEKSTAKNFFATYVLIVLITLVWLVSKFFYRGPWFIKIKDIDLVSGRRI